MGGARKGVGLCHATSVGASYDDGIGAATAPALRAWTTRTLRDSTDHLAAQRCHDARVQERADGGRARLAAAVVLGVQLLCALGCGVSDRLLVQAGHSALTVYTTGSWVMVAGVVSSSVVGAAVVRDQPRHPVGWLFLALSSAILLSPVFAAWYAWGAVARPGSLPVPGLAASLDNSSWIPWFVLVALILGLTPTGTWLSPRWRVLGRTIVVAGSLAFVLALLREDLDPPYDEVANPIAVPALRPLTGWGAYLLVVFVAIGLVACGASLVVRWRRAEGAERRRLLWLVLVAITLPVSVVGAFVAARAGADSLMLVSTGGFVVLVPVAAGLSITRYHLYDVDRVLARTTTYALLSVVLVAVYAAVVWLGAETAGAWDTTPEVAATVGALAAAVIAAPLRRGLQDLVDRRFSRRRYDAVRLVRTELAGDRPVEDLEDLFRRAFDDPALTVAYPVAGSWTTAAGLPAPTAAAHVEVRRHDRAVARVGFDPSRVDRTVVEAGTAVATTELDNVRLRAELAARLVEVERSRRRIAEAQRVERRRIERDLHDGAQQRLLALAFELQSAQLSGDPDRMRTVLADGAASAQTAVRDLRALANGLHPAALADGGLPAALDDLRAHSSVPVELDVQAGRLDPEVEFTAWLVLGEAVVNAQKHARAGQVRVCVRQIGDDLLLLVCDDGEGGANPEGPGLRGMRDRVEAAGGRIVIASPPGQGTQVEAVVPCAS